MNILNDIYKKSVEENQKNVKLWEDFLNSLNSLDLTMYADKLTVPILVPIGSKILFRGKLKHTNEVTVALGADYFAKCSMKQAEVLRQHRIKKTKSRLEELYKEKEYLESQIFGKININENSGKDIVEYYNEEEDKAWRETHRQKLKAYNVRKNKEETQQRNDVDDEELWNRLEELELQEELENELAQRDFIEKDEDRFDTPILEDYQISSAKDDNETLKMQEKNVARITHNVPKHTSKLDLLEQVLERQKTLESKLSEMKNREKTQLNNESELLNRLDEMEKLEELEDEMDRLDDILHDSDDNEEQETSSESDKPQKAHKQSISFADEDNCTLDLTFKHSDVEPCSQPYDCNKGIIKPSDIYTVYSNLFSTNEFKSILKKTQHASTESNIICNKQNVPILEKYQKPESNDTIIVKDVIEKSGATDVVEQEKRPVSLFKKKRQMKKQ